MNFAIRQCLLTDTSQVLRKTSEKKQFEVFDLFVSISIQAPLLLVQSLLRNTNRIQRLIVAENLHHLNPPTVSEMFTDTCRKTAKSCKV